VDLFIRRVLVTAAGLLSGTPDGDEYTDGVKLKVLLPGMLLGQILQNLFFMETVFDWHLDFHGSLWPALYDTIPFRKLLSLCSLILIDEEACMRLRVEQTLLLGDVGGMAGAFVHEFDPPPRSGSAADPVPTHRTLFPRPEEPTVIDDHSSTPRPALLRSGIGYYLLLASSGCLPGCGIKEEEQFHISRVNWRVLPVLARALIVRVMIVVDGQQAN